MLAAVANNVEMFVWHLGNSLMIITTLFVVSARILLVPVVICIETVVAMVSLVMLGAGLRYLYERREGMPRETAQRRLCDAWSRLQTGDFRCVEWEHLVPGLFGVGASMLLLGFPRPI